MLKLRYYCQGKGKEAIRKLLTDIDAKHGITYEILDLSANGEWDNEKEKIVYNKDFKLRARVLKKRTGIPITKLRSRRARNYFVSTPGTIAIVRDNKIEWYTFEENKIIEFLKEVLDKGYAFLEKLCKNPDEL